MNQNWNDVVTIFNDNLVACVGFEDFCGLEDWVGIDAVNPST